MTKKQKKMLYRILISFALFVCALLLPVEGFLRLPFFLVPYAIVGWDVIWKAVRNIANGQVFDENFLMAVATLGAFGCGEYPEGVAVLLFYQVGELFQSVAVSRSRQSIADLMDIRPDYANVERDGQLVQVDPEEIAVGDTIVVKAGERVPLDGVVSQGSSALDTAALTGESLPRDVAQGDQVISGCVNLSGLLHVQVTKPFGESTVARILDLVENSSEKKAQAEHFITKFARYYTPIVVFAALALAVLPSLLTGGQWGVWVPRALNFLVVSCPCALVISIPLSFFGGIGGASKQGILVKGSNYLEALAQAGIVVFDKTGTLTQGKFTVTRTEGDVLEWAALAEQFSTHPISRSILTAWGGQPAPERVRDVEEIAGHGVRAVVDGRLVLAGSRKLMAQENISMPAVQEQAGTTVYVAVDGQYQGCLVISDRPKASSAQALRELKACGVRQTVMLTGDAQGAAQHVAQELGLDQFHAQLLPADKVERVEELLRTKQPKEQLVFVGDGINDAPVLSRADIGVAMGALGSDAAIEAADIVLMDDDLAKLPAAVRIAKKTLAIVKQNIVFAIGVKVLVLALSAAGRASMWAAVFADVGVSVLAILNASRMLRAK
ncbi:MAG: cadmium-translocating P-type ATPase [Oscillospiraceae bacterium]|nr:cadmium-translocating P-type ATPase [Oscillospiraceae bacterium]